MQALATISIVAGLLMLASSARKRFPCFIGAISAIVSGTFYLSLPLVDSLGTLGWIWFCLWGVALPVMMVSLISLVVLMRGDRSLALPVAFCGAAILCTIPTTFSFWQAAGLGVVRCIDIDSANKAVVDNRIQWQSFRGAACFGVTDLVFDSHQASMYPAPHL